MQTFQAWFLNNNLILELEYHYEKLIRLIESANSESGLRQAVQQGIKDMISKLLRSGKFKSPDLIEEAEGIINGTTPFDLYGIISAAASKKLSARGIEGSREEVISDTLMDYVKLIDKVARSDSWESVYGDKSISQVILGGASMRTTHGVNAQGAVDDRLRRSERPGRAVQVSQMGDEERGGYEVADTSTSETESESNAKLMATKNAAIELLETALKLATSEYPEDIETVRKLNIRQMGPKILYLRLAIKILEKIELLPMKNGVWEAIRAIKEEDPGFCGMYSSKLMEGQKSHCSEMKTFLKLAMHLADSENVPEPTDKVHAVKGQFYWLKKLVYEEEKEKKENEDEE